MCASWWSWWLNGISNTCPRHKRGSNKPGTSTTVITRRMLHVQIRHRCGDFDLNKWQTMVHILEAWAFPHILSVACWYPVFAKGSEAEKLFCNGRIFTFWAPLWPWLLSKNTRIAHWHFTHQLCSIMIAIITMERLYVMWQIRAFMWAYEFYYILPICPEK